jgi:hypothetical protein
MASNIVITLHGVYVEINTSHDYPDALHDLIARGQEALKYAVELAKENNIDITTQNIWVDDEDADLE